MNADLLAVQTVHAALYEAFEQADAAAMALLWDEVEPDAVVCVHPGWPMLRGRGQVLRSWAAVMAGTDYIQFFLTDVQVRLQGGVAVITCTENMLTEVSERAPQHASVVATNVLVQRADGWRVQAHHASPVLGRLVDEDDGAGDGGEDG